MYKEALQKKLRFPFRGQATTEDLFDLGLEELDTIYRELKAAAGDMDTGLIQKRSKKGEVLAFKLEIVKNVYETKEAAIEARKTAADRKEQKDKILQIMAKQQDAALENKTAEELEAMLDEL